MREHLTVWPNLAAPLRGNLLKVKNRYSKPWWTGKQFGASGGKKLSLTYVNQVHCTSFLPETYH